MNRKCLAPLLYALLASEFFIRCNLNPQENLPAIEIEARAEDTIVAVRDTVIVTVETADRQASRKIRFCWSREGSWRIDTTEENIFRTVWHFPDTGMKRIVVWATDPEGKSTLSDGDTVFVHIVSHVPQVQVFGPQSAVINHAVVVKAEGADRDGTIERFEWRVSGAKERMMITEEDSLAVYWTKGDTGVRTVIVTAVDNDGLRSLPDTLFLYVGGFAPRLLSLSGKSSVSVNDTVLIFCNASDDDGKVTQYQWSIDAALRAWLSTTSDTLVYLWRMPDTGMHVVRCHVVDDDGLVSRLDSITVHVSALPPRVSLKGPRVVKVNDSAVFVASSIDDDGMAVDFQWLVETSAGPSKLSTSDSSLTIFWSAKDAGIRRVEVVAVDDDSMRSAAARCTVLVLDAVPRMTPIGDTTILISDTLLITRSLVDTSRRGALYFWDISGNGWDDSTESPQRKIYFTGVSPLMLIVGVRDTDGNFFSDTTAVTFNRPPVIDSLSLSDGDTVWMGEEELPGSLRFYSRIYEADNDKFDAFLIWGCDPAASDTIPCVDTALLPVDSIGTYRWNFTVTDSRGQRTQRSGFTVIGLEHTVCFAGHSIVAGYGGDNVSGGFRAGVLAGLRDSIGPLERVRAVGPLTTSHMASSPVDDSCFAITGSQAREMLLLMDHAYGNLTADVWVLMLGVNDGFSDKEMKATTTMMNRMLSRNPKARVYVITSPPLPATSDARTNNVQRPWYNRNIRDTVALLASKGYATSTVDGDIVLSKPDGTFNDTLFTDNVHPNQHGYHLLRDEILRIMWNSAPRVLPYVKEGY